MLEFPSRLYEAPTRGGQVEAAPFGKPEIRCSLGSYVEADATAAEVVRDGIVLTCLKDCWTERSLGKESFPAVMPEVFARVLKKMAHSFCGALLLILFKP